MDKNCFLRFKHFEIRKPTYFRDIPEDYRYRWDIVKWDKNFQSCFSIASLYWDKKEYCFEFKSCGLRYLEHREVGLEAWIGAWCKMQEIVYKLEEEEEEEY